MNDMSFFEVYGGNLQRFFEGLNVMPEEESHSALEGMINFLRVEAPRAELQLVLKGCNRFLFKRSQSEQVDFAELIATTILNDSVVRERVGDVSLTRDTEVALRNLKGVPASSGTALSRILSSAWGNSRGSEASAI